MCGAEGCADCEVAQLLPSPPSTAIVFGTLLAGEGVGVFLVGRAHVHQLSFRRQKASHWPRSLRYSARRWHTLSVPGSRQRMPASFRRCPTTVLQADSTAPEPISQPFAR